MKKPILAALAISSLSLPVYAEGLYTYVDYNRNTPGLDSGAYLIRNDDSTNGYNLGLGYSFSVPFAVELGYRDLLSTSSGEHIEDEDFYFSTKIKAVQLSLVAHYSFTPQIAVFGRLGLARAKIEYDDTRIYYNLPSDPSTQTTHFSKENTDTKAVLGIGLSYAFSTHWAGRLEYSHFGKIDDSIASLSSTRLGIKYQF